MTITKTIEEVTTKALSNLFLTSFLFIFIIEKTKVEIVYKIGVNPVKPNVFKIPAKIYQEY